VTSFQEALRSSALFTDNDDGDIDVELDFTWSTSVWSTTLRSSRASQSCDASQSTVVRSVVRWRSSRSPSTMPTCCAEQLDTQSSPMMPTRSCGLIGRCYVWKERCIGVMSLKVREINRERCSSSSTNRVVVMWKPNRNPTSLPMTSTASYIDQVTKIRSTLLWMLRSRHTINAAPPGCMFGYFRSMDRGDVIKLIKSLPDKQCASDPMPAWGYLKHVPAIWHPFCVGCLMRRYFQVYFSVLSSQRMLRRYWRSLAWLKMMLRITDPFRTYLSKFIEVAWEII